MVVFASATMTNKRGNKTLYRYIFEEIVMKKTTLLSITLLLCPGLIFSMDQNDKNFPKVGNPKKNSRSKNIPIQKQSDSTNSFSALKEQKLEELNDSNSEAKIVDTVNTIVPNDTKIENNNQSEETLSFALESSSPKEQYNRSTISVLWNSLSGRSWTDIVNDDWLNKQDLLEKKYHTRCKNEIIKSSSEQIKFIESTWNKEAPGSNIDIFKLVIEEQTEKANHELIIKLKNGLHNNKNATALVSKFLTISEKRGVKMEDSTTLEMLHKTLYQERFKLRLLLLSTFMYAQERMTTMTNILNNIVHTTPHENKEKIQKTYPAFEEDSAQYSKDDVLFKDMLKNKEQIKKLLINKQEQEEKLKEEQKSKMNDKK